MKFCLSRRGATLLLLTFVLTVPVYSQENPRANKPTQAPPAKRPPLVKVGLALPVLEVTKDLQLDPLVNYGPLVIKTSNITIDGQGVTLIGSTGGLPKERKGTAIRLENVTNVTIKNVTALGWETGLHASDVTGLTVEHCNFSDNFHDPDFGWGENGRRGGILLERVQKSTLRKNKVNRVWDACVLVDSHENTLEDNDFSHTSNTCLKLWNSSRNRIAENRLTHGIRISPGEVHARDSTCVLMESGSNHNEILSNDCRYGGDGIFVRVLNGWCSTDNLFQHNDCSYANNNGFECWAPRNYFVKNKANHCSYGFWLGGSDKTHLVENEASFNGLATGHHNSPHLPANGHAGIVFMFGSSSHTVCRGNTCMGNNGAGIALLGDLETKGKKWKAYHWIIEQNELARNRWGIYAKHADWITLAGNKYQDNTVKDLLLDGDVTRVEELAGETTAARRSWQISGPVSVPVGQAATWSAAVVDAAGPPIAAGTKYSWDVGDGRLRTNQSLEHLFDKVGFQRIGLNVFDGKNTELAWQDVYVVRNVKELGTEGNSAQWSIEDFHDRQRSNQQTSRAAFSDDTTQPLVGKSALQVVIRPYQGFRAALTYPKSRDANWSLDGKTKLTFWLRSINEDTTGWQGGPFIALHGEGGSICYLEPKAGLDLMRTAEHSEAREGWRLLEISLAGDAQWQVDGKLPEKVRALSLCFDSWGAPTLRFWIDGLAFE